MHKLYQTAKTFFLSAKLQHYLNLERKVTTWATSTKLDRSGNLFYKMNNTLMWSIIPWSRYSSRTPSV